MKQGQLGRLLAIVLASTSALFAVSPAQGAEPVPEVVRISWYNNASPIVLAKADGTLEKSLGTKIRWDYLQSGGAVLTALAAKEVDISVLGSPPTAAGLSRGLAVDVIAFEGVIAMSERLIARPEITSMKDLEGKRVAYTPGTSAHYALNAALKSYNIDVSRVKLISLGAADMVAAWKRGDIDAGYVWSPFVYQMETDKGHVLLSTKDLQSHGYFVWNNYLVRREFAEKYPNIVVAFLKTYQECVNAYRADPAGASRIISTHLGQDYETVRGTMAGRDFYPLQEQLSVDWMGDPETKAKATMAKAFMDTAQFLVTNGDLRRADIPKSFAPMINPTYAQRAIH